MYLIFNYFGEYFSYLPEVVGLYQIICLRRSRKQIIYTAQQPRAGSRKIYSEVIKDKVYCQVQNTFLGELPEKNGRKLYCPLAGYDNNYTSR